MKANKIWSLTDNIASAESTVGDLDLQLTIANKSTAGGATISVGRDAVSLFSITSGDKPDPTPGQTLPSPSDLYVRGNDFIASYQSGEDALDRELYWRISNAENGIQTSSDSFAIEMIFSLQTDLLDTRPEPEIVSALRFKDPSKTTFWSAVGDALAGELKWESQPTVDGCQMIVGQLAGGTNVVVAVNPTDLMEMDLQILADGNSGEGNSGEGADSSDAEVIVTCRLNADFLEKGVIRRTRLFAAFFDSAIDEAAMVALGQQFLDSETPLTT